MQLTKWIWTRSPSSMGMGSSPPSARPPLAPTVSGVLFIVLVRNYAPYIRRMGRDAGVPDADLADVSQEVFLALHLAIGRGLNVAHPLKEWLQTTTYRIVRDRFKRACNTREVLTEEGEIDSVADGPSPEGRVEMMDVSRMVLKLLDELPHELRMVLAMNDIDEMPMRVIAEVLEIPEGTGYSRLRAARLAFKKAWTRQCEEQAPPTVARGLAPFLLFEASDLLKAERAIPDAPHELDDQLWDRLVKDLGPDLTWGDGGPGTGPGTGLGPAAVGGGAAAAHGAARAVAAAKGGAAVATAGKAVAVLVTVKQIAIGVTLSIGVGAGLHAALRPATPDAALVAITREDARAAAAMVPPQASGESRAPIAAATAIATATATAEAHVGAAIDLDAAEKDVLARAQAALGRAARAQNARDSAREITFALAALDEHERRFRRPMFGDQRDALRRQALAYQTAHPIQDGGPP